jgi:hypothetical protein
VTAGVDEFEAAEEEKLMVNYIKGIWGPKWAYNIEFY